MTLNIMTLSLMTLSIMTLIIMTLSIMTLIIMTLSIMAEHCYTECRLYLVSFLLSFTYKSSMLNAIMVNLCYHYDECLSTLCSQCLQTVFVII
jgi:hypothetical protein